MNREILTREVREVKLGVHGSRLASVRSRSERETAVRVFSDGRVGTASAVGATSVDALTEQARDALSLGIPYAPLPSSEQTLHVSHSGPDVSLNALSDFAEGLLATLREDYPTLIFSEGVTHQRETVTYRSDRGLDLSWDVSSTAAVFFVKERGSANIIDSFSFAEGTTLTRQQALDSLRPSLESMGRTAPAPSGRTRVVFAGTAPHNGGALLQRFQRDCTARAYATGSSLFSGRIGDTSRPFHPAFRLLDTRDASRVRVSPFDMEGVVRAQADLDIVRDGALQAVAADKRDAARFGLPATGSAIGPLATLPVSGFSRLEVAATAPALVDLLQGEPGVLIWMASGGDVTSAGDVALPVQVAFQLDAAGNITHRLGGTTFTGSIFDIFGADFVGSSEAVVQPGSDDRWLVTHMTAQG